GRWRVRPFIGAIERVRLVDAVFLVATQDPSIAHEPCSAPGGEGTTAKAYEKQLVVRFVVFHQEAEGVSHDLGQTKTESATADTIPPIGVGAYSVVIEHLLLGAVRRLRSDRIMKLDDICRATLSRGIPGAIAAHNQPFRHGASPALAY